MKKKKGDVDLGSKWKISNKPLITVVFLTWAGKTLNLLGVITTVIILIPWSAWTDWLILGTG